ncbi:MAG: cold shock domain-containing protein [Clostridiales bacterium]|nr:cold shock domain-containing protein [Clostridiales bacterium]
MTGKCKWYRRNSGCGYITAEDGTEYYVHQSQIRTGGFRKLERGETVVFTPGTDSHGRPWAEDVRKETGK